MNTAPLESDNVELPTSHRTPTWPRRLIILSGVWSLLVMVVVTLQALDILPVSGERFSLPSWSNLVSALPFSGGYLFMIGLLLGLHGLALYWSRRRSHWGLILIAVLLLILSILTGFTVGIFIFPSALLMVIALILLPRS